MLLEVGVGLCLGVVLSLAAPKLWSWLTSEVSSGVSKVEADVSSAVKPKAKTSSTTKSS
jgi:hypothetical protein